MKRVLFAAAATIFWTCSAIAADDASQWRKVDPQNLVLIETQYGTTAVELAPSFAPKHVERLKALVRAHFYDGLSFYRVIEGFVAQGGAGEDTASTAAKPKDAAKTAQWPALRREFEHPFSKGFTPLGSPDLFARQTGHVDGFPVGRDTKSRTEWMIHCPGTFAFARDDAPDTATTEFYIVIGEAPRRLDRNLTAFGRVIADPAKQDKILSMRLASDIPEAQRPSYEVMRTDTKAFARWKAMKKNPAPGFYFRQPPPILDICLAPVPSPKIAAAP